MRLKLTPARPLMRLMLIVFVASVGLPAAGDEPQRNDTVAEGKVPQVVGLAAEEAKAALAKAELKHQFILGIPAPKKDLAFRVYAQKPSAGAQRPANGLVQLTIYAKPKVAVSISPGVVPALGGLTPGAAKTTLAKANLKAAFHVGSPSTRPDKQWTVYRQRPAPGEKLEDGSRVDVMLLDETSNEPVNTTELSQVAAVPFVDQQMESVERRSGKLMLEVTDAVVPAGAVKLELRRYLQIVNQQPGLLGRRWRMNWEKRLLFGTDVAVLEEGVGRTVFTRNSQQNVLISSGGETATLVGKGAICLRRDGSKETYGPDGRLREINRRNGNLIRLRYDSTGQLSRIDGPFNTHLRFVSDRQGRVTSVKCSNGAEVRYVYGDRPISAVQPADRIALKYGYDRSGMLVAASHPISGVTRFAHDVMGRVTDRRWSDGTSELYQYDDQRKRVVHIDAAGHQSTSERVGDQSTLRITNAAGKTSFIEYDQTGRASTVVGPSRQVARTHYDHRGRITSVSSTIEGETRFEYDGDSQKPVAAIDPNDDRHEFEYDEHLNLLKPPADNPDDVAELEYLPSGLFGSATTKRGQKATFTYDENGNPASLTDALGQMTKFEFDERRNLLSLIDPRGNQSNWEYDSHNRMTREVNPNGSTVNYQYSPSGLLTRLTDQKERWVAFEYDSRGRISKETDYRGGFVGYSYSAVGNVATVTDQRGNKTSYQYDALGRRSKKIEADGREVEYRYDSLGNPIARSDSLGGHETLRYDAKGNITSFTNSADATFRVRRNEADGTVEMVDAQGAAKSLRYRDGQFDQLLEVTDRNGDRARYEYDALGQLKTVVHPAGGESRYAYDDAGNVSKTTPPAGKPTAFEYDGFNQLVSSTDAKGQSTKFQYDRLGQLTRKVLADGQVIKYEYDSDGNRILIDDGRYPVRYTYDADGNRTSIEYPAIKRKLTYGYDKLGRLIQFVDSEGRSLKYSYDQLDRLTVLQLDSGGEVKFAYDAAGRVASIAYPNGTQGAWKYNREGDVTELVYRDSNGKELAGWSYAYDANSNLVEAASVGGKRSKYSYDPSGQLQLEIDGDGERTEYKYQAGGNRALVQNGGKTTVYDCNPADQVTRAGDEQFAYDANGNLVERRGPNGVTKYEYDTLDQLVKVKLPSGEEIEYGYAPTGERVWRKDNDGKKYYVTDGLNVLGELDGDLAATTRFLHGPGIDQPLMMFQGDASFCLHAERMGSIRLLTGDAGEVDGAYDYDAFGNLSSGEDSRAIPFAFSGREYDEKTGLYYYRARYYDPGLGRFISVDPVAGSQDLPITLNPYQFVLNNPLRYVDPMGAESAYIGMYKKTLADYMKGGVDRAIKSLEVHINSNQGLLEAQRINAGYQPGGSLHASKNTAQLSEDLAWMRRELGRLRGLKANPPKPAVSLSGGVSSSAHTPRPSVSFDPNATRQVARGSLPGRATTVVSGFARAAGRAHVQSWGQRFAGGLGNIKASGIILILTGWNVFADPESTPHYVSRATGIILGGAAGTATGGPVGGIAGGFAGDALGGSLVPPTMVELHGEPKRKFADPVDLTFSDRERAKIYISNVIDVRATEAAIALVQQEAIKQRPTYVPVQWVEDPGGYDTYQPNDFGEWFRDNWTIDIGWGNLGMPF